jgi:hypothetical protein
LYLPEESDACNDSEFCCSGCEDEYYSNDDDDDEDEDRPAGRHAYSYCPDPIYHRSDADALCTYIGVEIEAESITRSRIDLETAIATVCGSENDWYAKSDGSLNYGVEFVSHPRTMASWLQYDWSTFDRLATAAPSLRSYNTHTCGMHVHVTMMGRGAVSRLDAFKIATMMAEHPMLFLALSRRPVAELNSWAILAVDESKADRARRTLHRSFHRALGKYAALNMGSTYTAEFRLFRGTLNTQAIMRNIALVAALCAWAKVTSLQRLTESSLRSYVDSSACRRVIGKVQQIALSAWLRTAVATYTKHHSNAEARQCV